MPSTAASSLPPPSVAFGGRERNEFEFVEAEEGSKCAGDEPPRVPAPVPGDVDTHPAQAATVSTSTPSTIPTPASQAPTSSSQPEPLNNSKLEIINLGAKTLMLTIESIFAMNIAFGSTNSRLKSDSFFLWLARFLSLFALPGAVMGILLLLKNVPALDAGTPLEPEPRTFTLRNFMRVSTVGLWFYEFMRLTTLLIQPEPPVFDAFVVFFIATLVTVVVVQDFDGPKEVRRQRATMSQV